MGPYAAEVWPSTLRTSGMGSAYGFGVGKIIGPIGLALIVGSSNIVKPDVTIAAIVPCSFISGPGRRSRALPMPLSGSRPRAGRSKRSIRDWLPDAVRSRPLSRRRARAPDRSRSAVPVRPRAALIIRVAG
jgi:hypothetical protein